MQDELPLLIQLQTHDNAVDIIVEQISDLDKKIKDATFQLDALKLGSKTAKENLVALQLKKKQLEADADEQEKLIKKHHAALNSLKTNDAYKGMLAEIEAAKTAQAKIEDDILVVMEQLDAAEKQVKEVESRLKSDESKMKEGIQKIEKEKSDMVAVQQQKNAERETYAATIPASVKRQYDALRRTRGGLAIVPVENHTCSGCQMKFTQSKMIEIKKAKSIILCDSCSRILYLVPEKVEEAPASTPPVASA